MAIDFAGGAPTYDPLNDAVALCTAGEIDVVLIVGTPSSVPEVLRRAFAASTVTCLGIGPRASQSSYRTGVCIDTGVAGIHERGTAMRMDDMPLPLRPALEHATAARFYEGGRSPAISGETLAALAGRTGDDPRSRSPEIAVADALTAAGQPQDTRIVLRLLAARLMSEPTAAARSVAR
jgi:hypothetical protein